MAGEEPKRVFGISLTETRFYVGLLAAIIVLIGSVWAAVGKTVDWMEGRTAVNFGVMIDEELTPPAGVISTAIDEALEDHEAAERLESIKRAQANERRLQRVELIVEMTFEEITGRKPPAPTGG